MPTTNTPPLESISNTTVKPKTEVFCRYCGAPIPADSHFCPSCGKILNPPPQATTLSRQIIVYLVSLCLPPFGLWYAWKYLRQSDAKSKKIGWAAIVLTIVSLLITIWLTEIFISSVNQQLNQSFGQLNGLGY